MSIVRKKEKKAVGSRKAVASLENQKRRSGRRSGSVDTAALKAPDAARGVPSTSPRNVRFVKRKQGSGTKRIT